MSSDSSALTEEDPVRRKSLQDIIEHDQQHESRMVILTAAADSTSTAKTSSSGKPIKQSATGCLPSSRRTEETQVSLRKCSIGAMETAVEYLQRFDTWDPYWEETRLLHIGITSPYETVFPATKLIQRAAMVSTTVDTAELYSTVTSMSATKFRDGDTMLLLRMIPKVVPKRYADTHQWPKGTLIQVNGNVVPGVVQRKQQSHDDTLWKGSCRVLNVGGSVIGRDVVDVDDSDTSSSKHRSEVTPQQLSIEMFSLDNVEYAYSLSFCRYRSVETIYRLLLDDVSSTSRNKIKLPKISLDDAWENCIAFISNQVSVVAVDDEDDNAIAAPTTTSGLEKMKCSLICPISKQPIKMPVRSRHCRHWQVCIAYCIILAAKALIKHTNSLFSSWILC